MVNHGDIIKVDLDPTKGHEQAGYRPVLVVSNNRYNAVNNMIVICPITNTIRGSAFHINLDSRTKTTGTIMCNQVRVVDLKNRGYKFIETLPSDLLDEVISTIYAEIQTEESLREEEEEYW